MRFMSIKLENAKSILLSHRRELSRLGTKHLAIFGSIARNQGKKSSDIDILVDFDSKKGFFCFC